MPRKKTQQEFLEQAKAVHGDLYDYSEAKYVSSNRPLTLTCTKCCLRFKQVAFNHLRGAGCRSCKAKSPRKSSSQFISEAQKVHGDLYDYSRVQYNGSKTKVLIKCRRCGKDFHQFAGDHLAGRGCWSCVKASHRLTQETFISEAQKVHGDLYDYSETVYKTLRSQIKARCRGCGSVFKQNAKTHLRGSGCQDCANIRCTTDQWIKRARKTHGDLYDYSETEFLKAQLKVKILCPDHGAFFQEAASHLRGTGCAQCAKGRSVSKPEREWLDSLGVPERQYRATLVSGKRVCVDGYDPETNTIYEFLGDIWHGNPAVFDLKERNPINGKVYGKLHEKTMKRLGELREAGYTVVYIWENDWSTVRSASVSATR